jgi:hypothetical protein
LEDLFECPVPLGVVMAGLVPAIHVFGATSEEDVDARDKPGLTKT